jgi:hypothetical protein
MPKQNMDISISAFTISRVTPQPQGSIVSASVLIMKEMKRLVNYKFYKEKGGSKISRTEFKNDYTKLSLFIGVEVHQQRMGRRGKLLMYLHNAMQS